jgi:putative flippase GtrA
MAFAATNEMKIRPAVAFLPQLSRYSIASVVALAIDIAVYVALCSLAVNPLVAGVVGYAVGMVAHYAMSTSFVFAVINTKKSGFRRLAEFAVSGLVGLGITGAVIATLTQSFAVSAIPAKIAAVIISFLAVFLMRRWIVFASRADEKNMTSRSFTENQGVATSV